MPEPFRMDVSWREWFYEAGPHPATDGLSVGDHLPMVEAAAYDALLADYERLRGMFSSVIHDISEEGYAKWSSNLHEALKSLVGEHGSPSCCMTQGVSMTKCPKCNGTGEDWADVPTDSGALNGEECPRCGGAGEVQTGRPSNEDRPGALSQISSPREKSAREEGT